MSEFRDFDPESVSWVLTDEDLDHLCSAIGDCEEVICDLETTGLFEYAVTDGPLNAGVPARIVLAALTLPMVDDGDNEPTTWVVPLFHPDSPWLGRWRRVWRRISARIRDTGAPLINANVKFDTRWTFAHTGVDLSHLIVWDTMISSHLLDENASTKLKVRAHETFGVPRWDDFDLSVPGAALRVPLFDLGMYGARDTYWTWRLAVEHREQMYLSEEMRDAEPDSAEEIEVARLGRLAVWCAMPTTATLAAIEQRGMVLDADWVKRELAVHLAAAEEMTVKLCAQYPWLPVEDVSFAPTSHWFRDWAEAAVAAGDLQIASLTPTGKPKWSKGVLVRQSRHGSPVAKDLLALRGHAKKAEFLASWLNYQAEDGRIHASYNAGRVVTGRLSSSEPNMQQVTAALKPAFVPSPGYVLADLDYGQIEMRVAAFVSRSETMLAAFRNGEDLHSIIARQITGRQDVTPEERQHGKAGNFGFLFGMGPYGFREYAETAYDVSFTMAEAVQIHKAFFTTWTGIAEWHAKCMNRCHDTGQIVSPIGRVRRLPSIWDENEKLASYAERASINAPVQGFASDLMQMAAASIEGTLPGVEGVTGARIVGTVHDSILVEVPADDWERVTKECQSRMIHLNEVLAHMECAWDVPLIADAKIGTRWGLSDIGVL